MKKLLVMLLFMFLVACDSSSVGLGEYDAIYGLKNLHKEGDVVLTKGRVVTYLHIPFFGSAYLLEDKTGTIVVVIKDSINKPDIGDSVLVRGVLKSAISIHDMEAGVYLQEEQRL